MTISFLIGLDLPATGSLEQMLIRGLAVAGGAAIGALAAGMLTQVSARLVTTKKVPPWPLRIIRILGAVALALITAMILFGSGGGLGGGGGGFGLFGGAGMGEGTGKGDSTGPTERAVSTDRKGPVVDTGKGETAIKPPSASSLRVEILGDTRVQSDRFYRLEGEDRLRTLAEVRDVLRVRKKSAPPLEGVILVIYKNSPDEQKHQVLALRNLAEDLGLTVGKELPARDAP